MASCESAVAAVAPWDATLYSEFSSKFDRRIAALGPSFASRLEKLSAAVRSARQLREAAAGTVANRAANKLPSTLCAESKLVMRRLSRRERSEFRCGSGRSGGRGCGGGGGSRGNSSGSDSCSSTDRAPIYLQVHAVGSKTTTDQKN